MFFVISPINNNSRIVLTFTATLLLKVFFIRTTCAVVQATSFFLPFIFYFFPTFPFAASTAYPNDFLFDGNYTTFCLS